MEYSQLEPTEEEVNSYLQTADWIRGVVISHTINLERNMDLFICRYFCEENNKIFELMELLVAERVEFNNKKDTFIQILKKTSGLSEDDFAKKYPKIGKDLKEIGETRNDFAHKWTKLPAKEDINNHVIVLRKFKNSTENIPYKEDAMQEIIKRIEKYSKLILELNKFPTPKESP